MEKNAAVVFQDDWDKLTHALHFHNVTLTFLTTWMASIFLESGWYVTPAEENAV